MIIMTTILTLALLATGLLLLPHDAPDRVSQGAAPLELGRSWYSVH